MCHRQAHVFSAPRQLPIVTVAQMAHSVTNVSTAIQLTITHHASRRAVQHLVQIQQRTQRQTQPQPKQITQTITTVQTTTVL